MQAARGYKMQTESYLARDIIKNFSLSDFPPEAFLKNCNLHK